MVVVVVVVLLLLLLRLLLRLRLVTGVGVCVESRGSNGGFQALARTEETLSKAQRLLGQLSGEKTRWERQVQELRKAINTLPSQMMLASGFCTYLSKTPEVC